MHPAGPLDQATTDDLLARAKAICPYVDATKTNVSLNLVAVLGTAYRMRWVAQPVNGEAALRPDCHHDDDGVLRSASISTPELAPQRLRFRPYGRHVPDRAWADDQVLRAEARARVHDSAGMRLRPGAPPILAVRCPQTTADPFAPLIEGE